MHRAENPQNVRRAVSVIEGIAKKYSDPSYFGVVTSLAMLNEPATYLNNNLLQVTRQYWHDAYGAARYPWRTSDKSGLALIISDGFQPLSTFENYMTEPEYENVSGTSSMTSWGHASDRKGLMNRSLSTPTTTKSLTVSTTNGHTTSICRWVIISVTDIAVTQS